MGDDIRAAPKQGRKLPALAFAVTLAVLVGGAVTGYLNARLLISKERLLAHSDRAVADLEGLLSTLKDAETGQRGYLLTDDPAYLQPYRHAMAGIQSELATLTRELGADQGQEARLAALRKEIDLKLAELERTISLQKAADHTAARAIVDKNSGKVLMDEIRAQVHDMERAESMLLRANESRRSSRAMIVASTAPTLISAALLALIFYLSNRSLRGERRDSEELERILDVIPASLWIAKDPDCHEIVGNRSAAAMLSTSPGQNVSQTPKLGGLAAPFRYFRDGRELAPEELPLQRAAATGRSQPAGELEIELHDGRRIAMLGGATPLLDERGQIRGAVAAFSDISVRKRAEAALQRNAALLAGQKEAFQAAVNGARLEASLGILIRTAIEQIGHEARCAFYIVDPARSELWHAAGVSEAHRERQKGIRIGPDAPGCGFAVYTGQPVIVPDVTQEPRWKDWLSVAEEGGFRACWSFPVETSVGKIVGTFAMYFKEPHAASADDRKLAEVLTHSAAIIISRHQEAEELAQSRRALEETDRQKDQFLALLGHELRNPLFPISTASELLSRTLPAEGHARFAVDIIKRQSAQLRRLVDDLLDVGRITQGRIQLQQMPVELASVIAQALETVEPKLREKQHEVSVLTSEVPLYVNGDFARLVQCFGNVLANAAKYTEPHGKVRIEARAEGDAAVVRVSDNGLGISPELLPSIFKLFVQGEQTLDRAEGGLGIGLSVVRRLVRMHGGEVTAESAGLGKGTTIEIRLPRIAQPAQSAASKVSLTAPARRVLIVEDNADAANSLALLLSMSGHQTQVASGGRQALEVIESFRPEVAFVDIGLPEINGYELAQRLRANLKLAGLRLVAVSGYGQAEDREKAREAGFDEHLAKPVDIAALELALATLCARGAGDVPENQAARISPQLHRSTQLD